MPKPLRVLALIVAAFAMMWPQHAAAQKGDACFGVQTGYISTNNSAHAGLFFQYGFSNHFRLSPEVGYVFRHQRLDAFTVDLNSHYPLMLNKTANAQLYPLVGINFSSWTRHQPSNSDDVTSRKMKWGVNLGAGFQFRASSSLNLKIEAKYLLISRYSSLVVTAGIGYCF